MTELQLVKITKMVFNEAEIISGALAWFEDNIEEWILEELYSTTPDEVWEEFEDTDELNEMVKKIQIQIIKELAQKYL